MASPPITNSLAPWLSIHNASAAVEFYKKAFDAVETYRLEIPDGSGLVAKLSIEGSEFWISGESTNVADPNSPPLGGDSVRMILTVANPDPFFDRALKAGAKQVFPIGIEHGWRLGRLVDPFGLHWEIGHPI